MRIRRYNLLIQLSGTRNASKSCSNLSYNSWHSAPEIFQFVRLEYFKFNLHLNQNMSKLGENLSDKIENTTEMVVIIEVSTL